MTSEIDITPAGIYIRYLGEVSAEEIERTAQRMSEHPDFEPTLATVWDFADATSKQQLDADAMLRLGSRISALRQGKAPARIAVVASSDADYGGARMFGGINAHKISADFRVFRDREEARLWALGGEAEGPRDGE